MKLFPSKYFLVELRYDRATTLKELSLNTKLTYNLVSVYTDKEFIGQVDDCGFKIISSEIGHGAICVFIGNFQDSIGEIEITIHKAFKVLLSILLLLPFIAFGITLFTNNFEIPSGTIIPSIFSFLFLRFVVIKFGFQYLSNKGINKMIKVIGIKKIEEKI